MDLAYRSIDRHGIAGPYDQDTDEKRVLGLMQAYDWGVDYGQLAVGD